MFGGLGALLDSQGGLYAWQIQFNLTLLRLVSFNLERYWSLQREHFEKEGGQEMVATGKETTTQLQDIHILPTEFDVVNFLGYVSATCRRFLECLLCCSKRRTPMPLLLWPGLILDTRNLNSVGCRRRYRVCTG